MPHLSWVFGSVQSLCDWVKGRSISVSTLFYIYICLFLLVATEHQNFRWLINLTYFVLHQITLEFIIMHPLINFFNFVILSS